MVSPRDRDKVEKAVDDIREEMVDFLQKLVRINTVVPPGNNYRDCAQLLRRTMRRFGYEVRMVHVPAERVERSLRAMRLPVPKTGPPPRVNVFARLRGGASRRVMHFSGHFDVVPPGEGWTTDPFSGELRDGRVYGRGSTDQKSGIAASLFAVEAIRRSGARLPGTVEQSATVDEEWGGETGLGYLVEQGYVGRDRQDFVVITECLDVDGICLGHRGLLCYTLRTLGRVGHGCMPQLAVNAVDKMAAVMQAFASELRPSIEARVSAQPIMPEEARKSNLSPIWIDGLAAEQPTSTIAALCTSFWNRWFNPEERVDEVRKEILDFLETLKKRDPELKVEYAENYAAEPVLVPADSELVRTYERAIRSVLRRESHHLLSPGIDDQRFVVLNGKIDSCILYGPGVLKMAHAPDECVPVEDLVNAAKVMALSSLDLLCAE
jgi:succinyl-diaminopimelate desuccinylase